MKAGAAIETERLFIRSWHSDDIDAFHLLNSDERVMKFFPFRRDRAQSAEAIERFNKIVAEDGLGWAAITLKATDEVIGMTGLAKVHFEAGFAPAVEIGWRLLPDHWARGYASEAAVALLAHGFGDLDLAEIVSFAVGANNASTAVMERIGMTADPAYDFDMPFVTDEHLRRHVFYRITRQQWQENQWPSATSFST